MNQRVLLPILGLLLLLAGSATLEAKPNFIYVLADDLGYGDIGSYGQKLVATPNLDRMAREGLRFTQHYSGSTVCAPTRSCIMTGHHTGHTSCRGNTPGSRQTLDPKDLTIAAHLQKAGYHTAMIGKWGLGLEDSATKPNQMGFDFFYGNLSQIVAHSYYPPFVWRNETPEYFDGNDQRTPAGKKVYVQERMANEALTYLKERSREKTKPFFLYLPFLIPHASVDVPEKDYAPYVGKIDEAAPYGTPGQSGYCYQPRPHAAFAGMVSRLDRDMGRILDQLEKLGLDDNTLVIFSSDNGPHKEGGADPDFFDSNGPLTGYKRDLTEGGIRVPMIAWWPGTIEGGKSTDHVSAHWDLFPTFSELARAKTPDKLDGISFVSTLHGQAKRQKQHSHLYWEFGERGGAQAIRKGPWKAIRGGLKKNPKAPIQLFHLGKDPAEKSNVAKDHPKIVAEMKKLFSSSRSRPRAEYALFPEDLAPAK